MINNCIKYIFNLRKYDHISASYDKLGWLRISERHDFQTLCTVYKMLHEPQPPYLSEIFILMNKVHERQMRSHEYYLQLPNTKITTFVLKGARLWNKLPAELCCLETLNSFKQQLKKLMY
jgi:hypothetical protein